MTIAVISMIRDNWGGSEELWAAMVEEALKQKHKVLHLCYEHENVHPKMQSLIDKGLKVYTRPSYREASANPLLQLKGKSINFLRKKINSSFKKLFQQKPDVILYNGTCYSMANEKELLKMLKSSNASFYILGHFNDDRGRGGVSNKEAELIKHAYERAKEVFFIAIRSLENAKRQIITGLPNSRVIRNPVNMSSIELIPFPEINKIEFVIVANLIVVHKGQDIVLEILSTEIWKQRNWHLNIYGSGEDENYLKELVSYYQLYDKVTFHGKVNDIRGVWEKSHILLMPSHMEGMPLAVVEAMLCGRPVIATDVGDHKEWIEEDNSGFIAEAPTLASFGKAMEKAWDRLNDWEAMGRNAHERAMWLYDPEPGKTLLKLITESIS